LPGVCLRNLPLAVGQTHYNTCRKENPPVGGQVPSGAGQVPPAGGQVYLILYPLPLFFPILFKDLKQFFVFVGLAAITVSLQRVNQVEYQL